MSNNLDSFPESSLNESHLDVIGYNKRWNLNNKYGRYKRHDMGDIKS